MKISMKGEYGLRAMLFLAMRDDGETVTSREIAGSQAIPEPYLRQILASLSRASLISSTRGPQGGHTLGRPAREISLRDILLALEGRTTSVDQLVCEPCHIEVGSRHCSIREVFLRVKAAVDGILADTDLESLAVRQQEIVELGLEIPSELAGALPGVASLSGGLSERERADE